MPLPPGLFLNRETGAITGTPTQAGTFTTTLRVRDAQYITRDIPISITIDPYTAPSLTGALDVYATKTVAYSDGLSVVDGTAPFTWTIASGTLPTGISINGSTGVIAGTPSDTSYTDRALTVRVTDALGSVVQYSFTLKYADTLSYPSTYPTGFVSTAYDHTPASPGGHAPLVFAVITGSIPAGLSFDTASGRLFGTPTTAAATGVTLRVTDAAGNVSNISPTLTISPAYVAVDVAGSVTGNSVSIEKASGAHTFSPTYSGVTVTGGTGSYTYSWARISGSTALSAASPSSLNTGFSGTVAPGASAASVFRLTVSDGTTSDTLNVTITITNTYVAVNLTGSPGLYAMRTQAYSASGFTRNNGKAPYSFAITSGTLPTGMSINASTGIISGTPTDTSYTNRTITVRVTDGEAVQDSESFTLQYVNALTLTGSAPAGSQGQAYTFTPTTAGGFTAYAYTVQSGTLPGGLSLNAGTGAITGTPSGTTAGTAVTIRVTDSQGNTADDALNFVIAAYTPVDLSGSVSGQSDTVATYAGTKTITPDYASLATNGGLGTITYSWARISGSTAITANASTTKATSFAATCPPNSTISALFRLTATDGTSSDTFDVTVELENTYIEPSLSGTLTARSTRTVAYSNGLTVNNGLAAFTWAIISGTLPTGLTINSSTGVISGTPTDTTYTTRSITVQVTDGQGRTASSAQSITYRDFPDMVASTLGYSWRTVAYSAAAPAGNTASTHALTYTITAGTLPTGVTINSSTGTISGTPTSTSYSSIALTVRATDVDGNFDAATKTLPYADILTAVESTPNVASGAAYTGSVTPSGGHSPYTYAVQTGALPTGITLNASTGAISGSSTSVGSYAGTFRVTDVGGRTADTASFAFDVTAALSISKSFTDTTENASYSGSATAAGGATPYTYSVFSGALPTGLSLNTSTGAVTGTPTTPGTFTFVIRVTDNLGATANTTSTQVVVANTVNLSDGNDSRTGAAPTTAGVEIRSDGTLYRNALGTQIGTWLLSGSVFEFEVRATVTGTSDTGSSQSNTGTFATWESAGFSRSYGVSIAANGANARALTITLELRRAGGTGVILDSSTHVITATSAAALSISKSFGAATENTAYSGSATAANGSPAYTYSVLSGSLPTGLSLNTSTGAVNGTPTTPGSYTFVIRATDSLGATADTTSTSVTVANTVNVAAHSLTDLRSNLCSIEVEYRNDGTVVTDPTQSTTGEWLLAGSASDFEIRATLDSLSGANTTSVGTFGSWLGLGTTRIFGISTSSASGDVGFGNITIELRRAGGTGVILDTCVIDLEAETF